MTRRTILTVVTVVGVTSIVATEALSKRIESAFGLTGEDIHRLEIAMLAFLVLLVINLVFHFSSIQAEELISHIQAFERTNIRALEGRIVLLTSAELYRELLSSASSARSRIYNCYFGNSPPISSPKEKKSYFQGMRQLTKKNRNVLFRRIVLCTPANISWILDLVNEYRGLPNVSLSVYYAPQNTILPLSVQLIDNSKVFLVHAAMRPPGQPRDIMVRARETVALFDDYYENIWSRSTMLIDLGQIRQENLEELQRLGPPVANA